VPFLRPHHAEREVVLPGMWQAAPGPVNYRQECSTGITKETDMLWTIVAVLLILWLLGFSLHVAGGLIHLLLVVALIVIVINLVSGRRAL
jgi:hypothetical protein